MRFDEVFIDDTKNVSRIKETEFINNGNIAIIDQGKELIAGYTDIEYPKVCCEERIVFGDHTRIFKYINFPFICGADGTKVFKIIDTNKINYKYMYYYLLSSFIPNTGYNRHFKWVKELNFNISKYEIQLSIVNILDRINKLIELRKKQLIHLNELIKSQFVEMFGSYVDNKYNLEIKTLDDYTDMITYGLTVRPKFISNGIDLISARELSNGIIDYDSSPKISEEDYNKLSEKAKPHKNEILFSKTGTIGYCALVEDDRKFAVTQNAARIVLKDINPKWMLYYLKTEAIQNYCKRQAKGNAVKDFQIQDMKKIPVLKCEIALQNKFVEIAEQINKQKFEFEESLKKLEEMQSALMQEYFG